MIHVFIVNPHAGPSDRTDSIRRHLERRKDLKSILFATEEEGHENRLMKEMLDIFDDEKVRIYICGGTGTLSNAIDALSDDDFDHVEIAFYPCGYTNDYLKNFGNTRDYFNNLDALIDGEAFPIDYVKCIADGDTENPNNEILFSANGIIANTERAVRKLRLLGELNPDFMYTVASLLSVPFTPYVDYYVNIDGVDYSREYKQIYVGNSVCLGGHHFPIRHDIDCNDGYINALMIKRIPTVNCFAYYMQFAKGLLKDKHPNDVDIIKCKNICIKRKDNKQMVINSDGEIRRVYSWEMSPVSGKLRFVLPKGAKFTSNVQEIVESCGCI